jgi:hypothetical protein
VVPTSWNSALGADQHVGTAIENGRTFLDAAHVAAGEGGPDRPSLQTCVENTKILQRFPPVASSRASRKYRRSRSCLQGRVGAHRGSPGERAGGAGLNDCRQAFQRECKVWQGVSVGMGACFHRRGGTWRSPSTDRGYSDSPRWSIARPGEGQQSGRVVICLS